MPKGGPDPALTYLQAVSVNKDSPSGKVPYVVVEATPELVSALASARQVEPGLSIRGGPPRAVLGPGDLITITIYESGPGGLFSSVAGQGGSASLPSQAISPRGTVTIPYAGEIRASGLTPNELEARIAAALKDRAIEPQVIVTVQEQRSTQVSVLGMVTVPGQFPLPPSGMRLLDAIAKAGGLRIPGHEAQVTLQRKGRPSVVSFNRLVKDGSQNIYVEAGDVVYVWREPTYFIAMGASGRNARYDFDAEAISLSDAMGMAAGMLDTQANPAAVFLYRMESKEILERCGYPVAEFAGPVVPTVYNLNLNTSGGMFLASQFRMRPHDVIYVANAPSVEINKFFTMLGTMTAPARDAASIYGIARGSATVSTTPIVTPTTSP